MGRIVAGNAARARMPERHQTAHTLRHTFCTLLAEAGVGLEVIAELAGHADIRTTRRYLQVRQHRLEEGIEQLSRSRAALAVT